MLHRHPPATERDCAVLVAMPDRGAVLHRRVLGPHDLLELGLHHLVQNAQADTNAEGQQPLLGGAEEIPECFLHPRRQPLRAAVLLLHYGAHGGSSRLWIDFALATVPTGPDKAKGTAALQTSTSYGTTS